MYTKEILASFGSNKYYRELILPHQRFTQRLPYSLFLLHFYRASYYRLQSKRETLTTEIQIEKEVEQKCMQNLEDAE